MTTEYDGLDPIEPDDALRLYLDHRQTELSKNTIQCHRYRLEYFVEWCEEVGLPDLTLHFPSQEAGFVAGDTEAKLVGQTGDGTDTFVTDEIRIMGGEGTGRARGR